MGLNSLVSGHMRVALTFVLAMVTIGVTSAGLKQRPSPQVGLYAADPNHLWNRIHRHFHVRVTADGHGYGSDTVDPLLWRETRYLLEGPSHQRAVGLLDEFLALHGERLITDPVKRVVLQRDLWAIFDWLANESEILPERRRVLMPRLARAIRRLALNRSQIDRLPDVYRLAADSHVLADRLDAARPERPFLPPDFFASSGPWVTIGGSYPIAPQHVLELSRSAFLVLWNLPGGSSATKAYLSKLWDFPEPYVVDGSFTITRDGERRMKVNPALPALPDGTQIALVRQILAIDDAGRIMPTKITESVQLRVFGKPDVFREFRMSRAGLFADAARGLTAVGLDDLDFITFSAKGMDPFEFREAQGRARPGKVLAGCPNCHQSEFEPGILSVRSVRQLLRPMASVDSSHERWARWFTQPIQAAEFKTRRYDWGLLQGLWESNPR